MYKQYFGFTELPFSIVPNSRFLFQSQRHKEAISRLTAGLGEGGGFAMLTGEVGTGKTTVARAMLRALDENVQAGLILNPTFSNSELLEAICDEFALDYPHDASLKQLSQIIHQFLLDSHANGIQTLLVIDEAQHLSAEVLEQLRLLTNLETESQKLLKVLLIGQPELQQKLQMPQLRQLAQRITGRYHLLPLDGKETAEYIRYRLTFAGGDAALFSSKAHKLIASQTLGIPRLINLVCDAALKQAYSIGEKTPSHTTVESACHEVMSFQTSYRQPKQQVRSKPRYANYLLSASVGALIAVGSYLSAPVLLSGVIDKHIEERYPPVKPTLRTESVFPSALKSQLASANDLERAVGQLYQVWGYQASVLDKLCLSEGDGPFKCHTQQGDLYTLRQQDTPAVLTIEIDEAASYAVIYALDEQNARLLVGEHNIELPVSQLESIWPGEFHRISRRYWNGSLKPGMQGEAVTLLDHHLSILLGKPSAKSDRYDLHLEEKVKIFQRWQGLDVDGIAGKRTLKRLEELVREGVPSLKLDKESV